MLVYMRHTRKRIIKIIIQVGSNHHSDSIYYIFIGIKSIIYFFKISTSGIINIV
jgi:hypothetical protein